ncbi:MAG: glycerol kinase GlpK [Candidatus Electryonea clarkiae]|nr:glycerol kinase GlpK [Candidatus Electryonea clarkiae]MDP8286671.1 glycerol kinase GlpK [Candidatus Electryonea clarkiae]
MKKYILAIDQGTTSSRALLIDNKGTIHSSAQREFTQHYPHPGWVEHDPEEIWNTQAEVIAGAMANGGAASDEVAAIGITNQRETTIVWDRKTGETVYPAIVWQDRRTSETCDNLRAQGYADFIRSRTGLPIDAYFSATKLKWILDNVADARKRADAGELCFGTIDSFLLWRLTGGKIHATDVSNASRTMLFNIRTLHWDEEILELLGIPHSLLPEVKSSSEMYGETTPGMFPSQIPIAGIAGDQQAALFGQLCHTPGTLKNTYGTGTFMMMNTGTKPVTSLNNLITTIAWQIDNRVEYALEGSVYIAGAVVQWLRDGLGLITSADEVEALARSVEDNGGVYMVPAFTGLGAPHWDQSARGMIIGLTRGTTSGHIARAALESIAYQVYDVLKAMEADSGYSVRKLRVDGGTTGNDLLMQFQSDLLGIPLHRPKITETTAVGAAYLAGLATGFWSGMDAIRTMTEDDMVYNPSSESVITRESIAKWHKAVERAKNWVD